MEDLRDAIRRELDLDYGPGQQGALEELQAHFPEVEFEEVDGEVQQLIYVVEGPTRLGEVNVRDARASGVDVNVDDELLFPIHAKMSYGELPIVGALVDSVEFRQTRWRAEAQGFVDFVCRAKPRSLVPRPFPWSAGTLCETNAFGWSTLVAGRSIYIPEVTAEQLQGAERLLAGAAERTGIPLGGIQLSNSGLWHFGTFLLGWERGEPLGPWSPQGWGAVAERIAKAFDAAFWNALCSCLQATGTTSWHQDDVVILLGSSEPVALAQGELHRSAVVGAPAWSRAVEAGDLVFCQSEWTAEPAPFVVRGNIVASSESGRTCVVDLAALDASKPVYMMKNAVQPDGHDESLSTEPLHVHPTRVDPPPPWTYAPAFPDPVVAARSVLRQRQAAQQWREDTGLIERLFGSRRKPEAPTLRQCAEAHAVMCAHFQPETDDPYRPPASETDIDRIRAIGTPPDALVELYRWHDGCNDSSSRDGLFSRAWFCSIAEGLDYRDINLEVRDDFRPSWHVIGHNGSGDVLVIELAPGPRYGWIAFWDHEDDNTNLAFVELLEESLDGEFDAMAAVEPKERARWVPTKIGPSPVRILPEALHWTDTTKLRRGTTLVTGRGEMFRAWLWWPDADNGRWLVGRRSHTAEGALAELSTSMRTRELLAVDSEDHNGMVREVLAPGYARSVSLCFPDFELAT